MKAISVQSVAISFTECVLGSPGWMPRGSAQLFEGDFYPKRRNLVHRTCFGKAWADFATRALPETVKICVFAVFVTKPLPQTAKLVNFDDAWPENLTRKS